MPPASKMAARSVRSLSLAREVPTMARPMASKMNCVQPSRIPRPVPGDLMLKPKEHREVATSESEARSASRNTVLACLQGSVIVSENGRIGAWNGFDWHPYQTRCGPCAKVICGRVGTSLWCLAGKTIGKLDLENGKLRHEVVIQNAKLIDFAVGASQQLCGINETVSLHTTLAPAQGDLVVWNNFTWKQSDHPGLRKAIAVAVR
eukprot:Polyplicarium_translucidae@DN1069_c0_g1_i1.p1